jgi:hypothetical protein
MKATSETSAGLIWSFRPVAGFGYAAVAMLLGAILLSRLQ